MPGLVVQHNLPAKNANNKMNANVTGLKKATEKLSSGYQINRAADNAAGLAISEKMRSQIRGLAQATKNANDGISLIQTAEGGLNETHAILQRMRELAVQSANGTYTQEDRDAISLEANALKSEIDRISEATEYNTLKLLDGSLSFGGSVFEYGAEYGYLSDGTQDIGGGRITLTANVAGINLSFTTAASGVGGENAVWNDAGDTLTINLVKERNYTDLDIQNLINNATQSKSMTDGRAVPQITYRSEYGSIHGAEWATTGGTAAGVRQVLGGDAGNLTSLVGNAGGALQSSDTIKFTANSYGDHTTHFDSLVRSITIEVDAEAGKEHVSVTTPATRAGNGDIGAGAQIALHLATGVRYSEKDIELILREAGYDYAVELTDNEDPDGSMDGYIYFNIATSADGTPVNIAQTTAGKGVGLEFTRGAGEGLTFQIGANGVEDQRVTLTVDNMGADALGVAGVDVSTQDKANKAIDQLDTAISKVSMQRAGLGALENRLEYTVNNLTVTEENLTNAESQIRDTDMATEMINYTKFNILQQASQAMLAQANQQPQAVLQLLG